MCVECVSGQRSIITPIPIAMSPTVQALTAQRDAMLEALREMVDTAKYARIDMDSSTGDILRHDALARARLAIARATTGETP